MNETIFVKNKIWLQQYGEIKISVASLQLYLSLNPLQIITFLIMHTLSLKKKKMHTLHMLDVAGVFGSSLIKTKPVLW